MNKKTKFIIATFLSYVIVTIIVYLYNTYTFKYQEHSKNYIKRSEKTKKVDLIYKNKKYNKISLNIKPLPEDTTDKLKKIYLNLTEEIIKGGNENLDNIKTNLNLIKTDLMLKNYGAIIKWETNLENINVLTGKVKRKNNSGFLRAKISLNNKSIEKEFKIKTIDKTLNELINENIKIINNKYILPEKIKNSDLKWFYYKNKPEYNFENVIIIVFILILINFLIKNQEKITLENEEVILKEDIVNFTTNYILLLNSGKSTLNILKEIIKQNKKETFFYKKLNKTYFEMKNGKGYIVSLINLEKNIKNREFKKFINLIIQDIKIGNRKIKNQLNDYLIEMLFKKEKEVEIKVNKISSKLILPMLIIFIGIIIIVLYPAIINLKNM